MTETNKELATSGARTEKAAPRANTVVASQRSQPLVIDMGKASKKRLRQLRRGRGKLMGEVMGAMEEIRQSLGANLDAELLPVVVTYRRRRRRAF